ncbi:MAG: glycosyltransferase [Cyanobacteria bacterium P01_A01_bin.84]
MKKLLIVATIPETLTNFFTYITKHLQNRGWYVDGMAVGISRDSQCLKLFDNVWDVDWSRNPLYPNNLLVAPKQIQAIYEQNQYDIVNITTPVAAFVTRFALKDWQKQGKVKIIYTAQGFHFYSGGAFHRNITFLTLEKIAAPWTDYLVVVNREDEEAAKQHHLAPKGRVRLIPGTGLNVKRFDHDAISEIEVKRVKQELGLTPQTPLLLSVAELIKRKHPEDILRGFALLNSEELHLAFAGDGVLMGKMQQLAKNLKVENRVHFLGYRRDIPLLIRASIATILASEQEGLPNCVMESLSMETPVIGTDIRGTRDLLEAGYGLLVKVGDIEGIACGMKWMLDNSQAAAMMGKRGCDSLVAYDVPHIIEEYERLYGESISAELAMV